MGAVGATGAGAGGGGGGWGEAIADAGSVGAAGDDLESPDASGASWDGVRRCVSQWLPTCAASATLTSDALRLLAAVAASSDDLGVPRCAPSSKFWKLRAMSPSEADERGDRVAPSLAALEAAAACAGFGSGGVRDRDASGNRSGSGPDRPRREGWHARAGRWIPLRLRPPPADERVSMYHRRGGGAADLGAAPAATAAACAALRGALLGDARGGLINSAGVRRVERRSTRVGGEARAGVGRVVPRAGPRRDGREGRAGDARVRGRGRGGVRRGFGGGRRKRFFTRRRATPRRGAARGGGGSPGRGRGRGRARQGACGGRGRPARDAPPRPRRWNLVRFRTPRRRRTPPPPSPSRAAATRARGPTPRERRATRAAGAPTRGHPPAASPPRSRRRSSRCPRRFARRPRLRSVTTTWRRRGRDGARAGANLAGVDDAARLAGALPGAAGAGLLDRTGHGTLHDAVRELIGALLAVASEAAEATTTAARDSRGPPGRRPRRRRHARRRARRRAAPVGARARRGRGHAGERGVRAGRADAVSHAGGGFVAHSGRRARVRRDARRRRGSRRGRRGRVLRVRRRGDPGPFRSASAAGTRRPPPRRPRAPPSAPSRLSARRSRRRRRRRSRTRRESPFPWIPPRATTRRTAPAWRSSPGRRARRTRRVSALCALSGVDASDETYEDGDRGPGVAAIAAYTIAGLEAALVGPGGDGDDASTGGASESRRAWLLAHAAQLAEGLTRRRNARKRAEQDDEDEDEDDDRARPPRGGGGAAGKDAGSATSRRRRRSPRRWRRCTRGCGTSSRTSRG